MEKSLEEIEITFQKDNTSLLINNKEINNERTISPILIEFSNVSDNIELFDSYNDI